MYVVLLPLEQGRYFKTRICVVVDLQMAVIDPHASNKIIDRRDRTPHTPKPNLLQTDPKFNNSCTKWKTEKKKKAVPLTPFTSARLYIRVPVNEMRANLASLCLK